MSKSRMRRRCNLSLEAWLWKMEWKGGEYFCKWFAGFVCDKSMIGIDDLFPGETKTDFQEE